jgi:hypothetical protein
MITETAGQVFAAEVRFGLIKRWVAFGPGRKIIGKWWWSKEQTLRRFREVYGRPSVVQALTYTLNRADLAAHERQLQR